jgi:hypothetical protein
VPHRFIDRIRQKILLQQYDMTVHALEEMAEDDLHRRLALDRERVVGVVGRFHGLDRLLIITVYDVKKYH